MSQAPPAPTRPRRGLWLAVVVGAIFLVGSIALTAVLNVQPPLQPMTVSSATP